MDKCMIPDGYVRRLSIQETESAIKYVKDTFEHTLADAMRLLRISAPLFVPASSGLNDNLSGTERPVSFQARHMEKDTMEIVHSLAKWKRQALKRYGFEMYTGLYTDMNAIRRDEVTDNLHSIYVDQWDWEKVIAREDRTISYLENTVRVIVRVLAATELAVCAMYPQLLPVLTPEVFFITTQQLEDLYPKLSPKQRENRICKKYGTVFIERIGDTLASGKPHDGRAPDYDDWSLNGDIIVWNDVLKCAFEISSMGIRVDETALRAQLEKAGVPERAALPFHASLLRGELPLSIGGGIGQSRICMLILQKCHIGEVQVSQWTNETRATCLEKGVFLL